MHPNSEKNQRNHLFIGSFVIALCICLSLAGLYVYNKSQKDYAQMQQIVLINGNKINNVITKLLYKTQVLAALVVQNDGEMQEFEKVASTIVDDPAIKNVLLAPDGIVRKIYPLEGNEEAFGFHFFEEGNGNAEAIQARDSGQLVLGGPFDLVQGGQALVGRLPIYLQDASGDKKFWGLASVTLNYPQALDGAELDHLQSQGFAYEIWRISPDTHEKQIIAASPYPYNKNARYVEKSISVLNTEWQFRISPIKNWYQYPETWILSICGLMASLLLASLIRNNYDLKIMQTQLEALTHIDALTGIMNRRGLLSSLQARIHTSDCALLLCYIDLDNFKYINDQYGHSAGDAVLQLFSSAVQKHIMANHLFARIGGDEFVLVFDDSQAELQQLLDMVKRDLDAILSQAKKPYGISFSYGTAQFPLQCQSIDDLLHSADCDMYQNKMKAKKNANQSGEPM